MKRRIVRLGIATIVLSVVVSSCSFSSKKTSDSTSEKPTEPTSEQVTEIEETESETTETEPSKKLITNVQDDIWETYWNTNIVFEEGEAELCVMSDIGLPTKVDDATVTWKSDNPEIIENDGTVHRPADYSPIVNLTATIETDDGYVEREFMLRVIRTELDDMKPEDVWVLDEVDQLYFFNDIIEDTSIYVNKEGYVTRVIGSIFEYKVDSPGHALLALHGIEKLIGCKNVYDELVIRHIIKDDYGYTIVFDQFYESYYVFGNSVTVTTDLDGNTNGLVVWYDPIDISTDYKITEQEAIDKLEECSQVIYAEVQIRFIPDDEPKMVWYIEYVGEDGFVVNSAIIDANSGEVLFDRAMMQD